MESYREHWKRRNYRQVVPIGTSKTTSKHSHMENQSARCQFRLTAALTLSMLRSIR